VGGTIDAATPPFPHFIYKHSRHSPKMVDFASAS
jgi:hypothetical protein